MPWPLGGKQMRGHTWRHFKEARDLANRMAVTGFCGAIDENRGTANVLEIGARCARFTPIFRPDEICVYVTSLKPEEHECLPRRAFKSFLDFL